MTGSRGSRIAIAALAAGLAAALPLTVEGLAAKPKIPATVSLHTELEGEEFVFRGRVRSDRPRCERGRRVEITAGEGFDEFEPVVEGITLTDRNGRYELRVKAATNTLGGYRAKALRKPKRRIICRAARSPIV